VLDVQAKNGFHSLTGIDYSSYAIELAMSIACDEQLDIEYKVMSSVLKYQKQMQCFVMLLLPGRYFKLQPSNYSMLITSFFREIIKESPVGHCLFSHLFVVNLVSNTIH